MGSRKTKGLKGNGGQSAIEFIAVVLVVFFFLFFIMSTAFVLVVSDYLDYATFMAARTYKTGSSSENQQRTNARIVWQSYVERLSGLLRSNAIDFVLLDPNNVRTSGVVTSYQMDLFYLPPLFSKLRQPSIITLNSEAHLGRDPSFEECSGFFIDFAGSIGFGDANLAAQMEDNGC